MKTMSGFPDFLKISSSFLKQHSLENSIIHFTLGNESCDLDSSVASIILAYFLFKRNPEKMSIPVLNVNREDFFLRTENCFVFSKAEMSLDNLIFRNEVCFEEILRKNTVTCSLVDHHILSDKDRMLAPYVTEIFDHRPIDSSFCWDPKNVQIRIEQVGSCCTLIAEKILITDSTILDATLAYLLYQTIIYDTIALKPEYHKATALDIKVADSLEKLYGFTEDRQMLFDRLWSIHNDVFNLTPQQLLKKDLKVVGNIYVPGLPMLVEEYLNLNGSIDALEEFANDHKVSCLLLVGLNALSGSIQRDVAIYSKTRADKLRKILLQAFMSNDEYNFMFEERKTKFVDQIHLLHMHNTRLSRKQLVPIVKNAWKMYLDGSSSSFQT